VKGPFSVFPNSGSIKENKKNNNRNVRRKKEAPGRDLFRGGPDYKTRQGDVTGDKISGKGREKGTSSTT